MARMKLRKAKAYSMHAFVKPSESELANYDELLTTVFREFRDFRDQTHDDEVVAIATVHKTSPDSVEASDFAGFQFVSGSEDTITIFDQLTGAAKEERLPEGQVSVSSTWFLWKPGSRVVFIESRRPGVSRAKIERYIERFAQRILGLEEFSFSLHPIAADTFEDEIEKFTRIREVRVVLKRPNHSWAPAKELIGAASESNAATVEIEARAERNKSLNKDSGIVSKIKSYARNAINGLEDVVVSGNMPNVEGERRTRLSSNQIEARAKVRSDASEIEIAQGLIDQIPETDFSHFKSEESD